MVTVDGVECRVTASTENSIECVTGAAAKESWVNVSQPGSPGMTLTEYKKADTRYGVSFAELNTMTPISTTVATSIDHFTGFTEKFGLKYDGWFKAPETGNYKFYLACDDNCKINLDGTNAFNKLDPPATQQTPAQVAHKYWGRWRDFWNERAAQPADKNSDWIPLQKGEFYKMDVLFTEWTSSDYLTAAVEFEKANTATDPNSVYEVQRLAITHDHTFEEWQINIVNPDAKSLQLILAYKNANDPNKIDLRTFKAINANASAHTWYLELRHFYWSRWGSNITVTKKNYDANDAETTVSADIVKSVINVKVRKLITEASFTQASFANNNSAATISVVGPSQATLSTPPLQGNYVIECPDEAGTVYAIKPRTYHTSSDTIRMDFIDYIPHLRYKTDVIRRANFEYTENGVEFLLTFKGYRGDVPQCTIKSDTTTPITGGANLQFISETIREHGTNLFFSPIPMEMLVTDE